MSEDELKSVTIPDTCSYFIKNKALFGSYPSKEVALQLEELGVKVFYDLTEDGEVPITYKQYIRAKYFKYPIQDRDVPVDMKSFTKFIIDITNVILGLEKNEKIYIHCRGGHGRSGLVVASIVCRYHKVLPNESLIITNVCHSRRITMNAKWRKLGSPQTRSQKSFVHNMFKPIYFYRASGVGKEIGLSIFSRHPVYIHGMGVFVTAQHAFNAHKSTDPNYIKAQIKAKTFVESSHLAEHCKLREDWEEIKDSIMYRVLFLKFEQNKDIKQKLLDTGLRKLINHTPYDEYWADGQHGNGQNKIGVILEKIRDKIIMLES